MSTYTQILYQIVFRTKNSEPTLVEPDRENLYRYMGGILKNKKCHLYRIGGVENHIHIITHIHPSVALASLVKDLKLASSDYIKNQKRHHKKETFRNEYINLLKEHQIEFDEKYLL